jgi:hypothetical protein
MPKGIWPAAIISLFAHTMVALSSRLHIRTYQGAAGTFRDDALSCFGQCAHVYGSRIFVDAGWC